MIGKRYANLAAFHLHRQRILLALWQHTLTVPNFGSSEWRAWLSKRQLFLTQLDRLSLPMEENEEEFDALHSLRLAELRIMEAISRVEAKLLADGQKQLHAMVHLLHMSAKRRVAHHYYRQVGRL